MESRSSERGQAIVLIVIGMVALFAFAGLAVDGGRVYSEQRRAQTAADSAAYAAALADLNGEDFDSAALQQAAINGFADADGGQNSSNDMDVVVNNPPQHGQYIGNTEYYEVIIHNKVPGTFSRIIMVETLAVQASAVVHGKAIGTISSGNAVHALNTDGEAMAFNGNISVFVNGGSIMSNAEIDKDGGSGDIVVTDGGILYVEGNTNGWKGNISPTPQKVPSPVFVASLPEPDCGTVHRNVPKSDKGKKVYSPGIYDNLLTINAHDDIKFEPGIYCFMNGLTDNGNSKITGNGVMFAVKGGEVKFNGNSEVTLRRADDLVDAAGNQWGGMLLYVPPSNTPGKERVLEITGNDETTFAGTIYAPDGLCRFGGTSKILGISANIICLDIDFHGTPDVVINYKASQNYRLPPSIELSE